MINHKAIQTALGDHLLDLEVVTLTGTIEATATGYTRSSGSFITDGFEPGMEVAGTGFTNAANNTAKTITSVAALSLVCSGCVAEGADTRTLTVGLPAGRAWENVHYEITADDPWVEENYLPAPMNAITMGANAQLECDVTYVVKVYVPINVGTNAARGYADALISHFAPRTSITVSGHTCVVRTRPAPYAGQLLRNEAGHAVLPVTVPLRVRTANII